MLQRKFDLPSVLITLLAGALVYGIGTTFFAVEVERILEQQLTPWIASSPEVAALERGVYAGVERFMDERQVRIVGYTCLALVIMTAVIGLTAGKRTLAALGSVGLILPVYGYFVLHMSFLAGLGVITALWAPFWGSLVRLGDIAYLPYMLLVYPAAELGLDARQFIAGCFSGLGLLIFILGVLAWFYARLQQKIMADFWLYRFTRHPQYLGWILWSYGLMLRVAQRHDTVLGSGNPGASLPWVISTLIIVCVALGEEIHLRNLYPEAYGGYRHRTPFMLPLPAWLQRLIAMPFRLLYKQEQPENHLDLLGVFGLYLFAIMLLSLPFVLWDWPPGGGWMHWPF